MQSGSYLCVTRNFTLKYFKGQDNALFEGQFFLAYL